jgi:hypothetical protein
MDGSQAERDRVSVTKNIKAALRKLGRYDAELAAGLAQSIKTGVFCAYLPIVAPGEDDGRLSTPKPEP